MRELTIAGRKVGDGHPPFIVAEVGLNHCGSVTRAIQMIRVAARAGVDAVKFGVFKADEFCEKSDALYDDFKRCELPDDAWSDIKRQCDQYGLIFFGTPQNESDLRILLKIGVPCVKIGSDDLIHTDLVATYASVGLPIILSTGMADEQDVVHALTAIRSTPVLVCVCTSQYPCPPEDSNLARITTLREMLPNIPIGFSDHTLNEQAALIAAALGSSYFEKHFTLDHDLPGPDHHFSANQGQLTDWVWSIRDAMTFIGNGEIKPSRQERRIRDKWRRKTGQQIRGAA